MRKTVIIALCGCLMLTGCDLLAPRQTEAEIDAEMAKIREPTPGLWSYHYTLTDFSGSGVPQPLLENAKRQIEGRGRLGQLVCVTPEMAKEFNEERLRTFDGATCETLAARFDDGRGKMTLQCNYQDQMEGTITLRGPVDGATQAGSMEVELTLLHRPGVTISYEATTLAEFKGDCPT